MSFLASPPRSLVGSHPEIRIPGSQQGDPVPYLFGTYDMEGTCIYPRDAAHMISRSSSSGSGGKAGFGGGNATGATNWYLNFAIVYCCNPTKRIIRIKIDNNIIWGGDDIGTALSSDGAQAGGYATLINGTLHGFIRFYFGLPNQATDSFFIGPTVNGIATAIPMPSWPGMCWCMFEDFQVGTSPSVPHIKVRCEANPTSPLSDPNILINTGVYNEANPVHVIADVLTNPLYGCGMDVDRIDQLTWNAAAAQVATEGLGISGYIDKQDKTETLINDILDDIGGMLVRRSVGATAVWAFKLIRRDYSFSSVPVIAEEDFSEAPTINPSVQTTVCTSLWAEYKDQTRDYTDVPVLVPNAALSEATNNARTERIQYKYFTAQQAALLAAQTKAPLVISPPDTIKFKLNRYAGFTLEVGDVIRPSYSLCQGGALDGSRVFRITKITRPVGGKHTEAEAREEFATVVFGTINVDVIPPSIGGSGLILNTPLPDQFPVELPWDLSPAPQIQVTHLCDRFQQIYSQFLLRGGIYADQFDSILPGCSFVQGGLLGEDYPATTLSVDDDGLVLTPGFGTDLAAWWTTESVLREQMYDAARLLVIADPVSGAHEFCAWETIEPGSNGNYIVKGIVRGLFDTPIIFHPSSGGNRRHVFLMEGQMPFTAGPLSGWGNGVTLNVKAVPYNNRDSADPGAMTAFSVGLINRSLRPFPVANLMVGGIGAEQKPIYHSGGGSVRISWIPRTRGAGIGYINPAGPFDTNIPLEGQFNITIYASDGVTVLRTLGPVVPGTTFTDGWGVVRHYVDYDPSLDSNPSSFIVAVTSHVGSYDCQTPQTAKVVKI